MHIAATIFIIALAMTTVAKLWLDLRQKRNVTKHKNEVPSAFSERISKDDHRIAADYTSAKMQLSIAGTMLSLLLTLFWIFAGGLDWLDNLLGGLFSSELITGTLVILSFFFLSAVVQMPFSLYSTFGIEAKFGFNKTTAKLFIADLLKSIVLSFILGVPLLLAILWFMQAAGNYWWFYAWSTWVGFSLLMIWAYPTFIAPWFNKFEPLSEDSLKQKIENLITRCGFEAEGVFVMDGSKRSSHSNAYFTGFGKSKRVVFFDTLIKQLSENEIEAVLAHELGHFKKNHIRKMLITNILGALAAFAILGWLSAQTWFYSAFNVSVPSSYMALLLFMLVMPAFTFWLTPLSSRMSRKHEFEADEFAASQAEAQDLVQALVKLTKENASTLTPDPWYVNFYHSHPPTLQRIEALSKLS